MKSLAPSWQGNSIDDRERRPALHADSLSTKTRRNAQAIEGGNHAMLHPHAPHSHRTYDLFISHPWCYDEEYHQLETLLKNAEDFKWRNHGVPDHDEILDPHREYGRKVLKSELETQIKDVHCVIILVGMYDEHREWILEELSIARRYGLPVIAVLSEGANARLPLAISCVVQETVRFDADSVVSAIRRHAV